MSMMMNVLKLMRLFRRPYTTTAKAIFITFTSAMASLLVIVGYNALFNPSQDEVLIIYTTDIKGNLLPVDFHTNKPIKTSLANLVTFVEEQRTINKNKMLLLDCGNIFSSGIMNYYADNIDTTHTPITYQTIKELNYDAYGVGSLDIDNPSMTNPRHKDQQLRDMTICANLIDTETKQPFFQPYKIFERNGVKVAVLGMVAPTSNVSLPGSNWRKFQTQDMIECAMKWMPEIQKHKPDVVIGMFHSGEDYEKEVVSADAYKNPNAGIPVAMYVPGFDVVLLGGDGRTTVKQMQAEDGHYFTVANAGELCQNAGMLRIRVMRNSDNTTKRVSAFIADLSAYEPDEDFCDRHQHDIENINNWVNSQIGYLADTLTGSTGIFGPTTYRSLIHYSQLWHSKADISICSAILGSDTIMPGPIKVRDLFHIYPNYNKFMLLDMNGHEVKRYLEYGFSNQFETISSPDEDMLMYRRDKKGHIIYNEDGRPYLKNSPNDYCSAIGIRYTVDVRKPAGSRVEILSMADGRPFDMKQHYRVAINSDLASGGSKIITQGIGWNQETLDMRVMEVSSKNMQEIIQDYITDHDTLKLHISGHWKIIPSDWWEKERKRIIEDILPVW